MREVRDEPDEAGDGDRVERARPGGGDTGAVRERIEPRDRSEYATQLEQRDASHRAQQDADNWAQRDGGGGAERLVRPGEGAAGGDFAQAGLEVLRGFQAGRAGLREFGGGEVAAYLEAHQGERPWLAAARDWPPEVQRVFAALDSGGGHAHIRHEGWVTEEMNRRRVAYLEDPAQLDPLKRAAGIDGLKSPEGVHRCRGTSSRITSPDAFAAAFARGIERPAVQAALETTFTADRVPRPVSLPLSDLLGPDGHHYCTGWRLQPVAGSMDTAREQRAAWIDACRHGRAAEAAEPDVRAVRSFAGGTIVFAFGPTRAQDGYEVVTMYPRPRPDG